MILPDPVTLLTFIAVFVPLERLYALHGEQRIFRKAWLVDAQHLLFNSVFIGLGLNLVLFATLSASRLLMPQALSAWVGSQPWWLQLPVLILLSDLCFYAVHRLFHKIPALWKFHAVHHSITEMDWLAAHRVHPIDQICTKGAALVPVFTLGFSAPVIAASMVIYQWQSLFIHSNTRFRFGLLEHCIASPRFHHWHHADHAEAIDRNFAGQVPLLDRLFGTLHMPEGKMPGVYGTAEPVPSSYPAQLYYPLQAMVRRMERQPEGGELAPTNGAGEARQNGLPRGP